MHKRFQTLIMASNRVKGNGPRCLKWVVSASRARSPLTAAYRSIDSGPSYGGESRSGPHTSRFDRYNLQFAGDGTRHRARRSNSFGGQYTTLGLWQQ
jgi:hypothetical protein